ncbi:MAG: bifunctional folylpolyglutamate synthase/dihydrofolate synthase [Acetatifactor sp.]|nr:bifunctional folylpolyglutamate synthase/dihydrofolate synthase [Acetatifactor sp.]
MKKSNILSFEEAESYINETPRFTTKHTMEDTRAFLHSLGDPDRKLKIVHVAGTNGKGSVCAYLRSILETAGYRVAVFTSPHLLDIRERFVVDGEMIAREDFLRVFLQVYEALDWTALEQEVPGAYHPSYFEILFFMAMLFFAEKQPDFCILETGLGGRLDATNSVAHKELAVITRIGLDHTEYLGDTVEKIAGEKAGIMAKNTPVVCWESSPEISAVFQEKAACLGIFAEFVSKKDYTFGKFVNKTIDFSLNTRYYGYISLTLYTIAAYQMENASLAVRAIEALDQGRTITAAQIQEGVKTCFWAGRMEEVLPEVYVDGAHNEDGIRAFLETVAKDGMTAQTESEGCVGDGRTKYPVTGRSLLFAAVKDKDCGRMVERLVRSGLFDRIAISRLQTSRSNAPEFLEQLFGRYSYDNLNVFENVKDAFESLLSARRPGERIYVAGSLYLAGEIKELISHDKF